MKSRLQTLPLPPLRPPSEPGGHSGLDVALEVTLLTFITSSLVKGRVVTALPGRSPGDGGSGPWAFVPSALRPGPGDPARSQVPGSQAPPRPSQRLGNPRDTGGSVPGRDSKSSRSLLLRRAWAARVCSCGQSLTQPSAEDSGRAVLFPDRAAADAPVPTPLCSVPRGGEPHGAVSAWHSEGPSAVASITRPAGCACRAPGGSAPALHLRILTGEGQPGS